MLRPYLSLALLAAAFTPLDAGAQPSRPAPARDTLTVGRVREDSLSSGDVHRFVLRAGAGQFVAGQVDQRTVDVVVTILAPDGRTVATFDDPARGPELFSFETSAAGAYVVQVAPFEREQGRYAVSIARVGPIVTTAEGRIDQLMAAFDRTDGPGAAIVVVRGGRTVFSKGYGMANLEHGVPIGATTVFDIASIAKQFTGLAIAMLAEQGRLSLDDDVRKHLPDMPDYGTPVTIRHLVHHTGGVRDWPNALGLAGYRFEDVIAMTDILALARRQRELNFPAGSEYLYSNTGYNLLARVVEVVTGQPFGTWMRTNILDPLGMTRTRVMTEHDLVIPGRASAYRRDDSGAWRTISNDLSAIGSSSIFSSTGDMAHWLANLGTKRVGGAAAHALMRQRGVLTKGDTIAYAFGISVNRHRGLEQLSHSGSWAGFVSQLHYYPALDAGVLVLANTGSVPVGRVAETVADALLGERMAPVTAAVAGGPQPAASAAASAAANGDARWSPGPDDLRAFAGRYYSRELEAFYAIEPREGARLVAVHRRLGEIALTPRERDAFTGSQWFFANVRFERDAAGTVTAMRVSNGRVRGMRFERVAERSSR